MAAGLGFRGTSRPIATTLYHHQQQLYLEHNDGNLEFVQGELPRLCKHAVVPRREELSLRRRRLDLMIIDMRASSDGSYIYTSGRRWIRTVDSIWMDKIGYRFDTSKYITIH